MFFLFQPVSHLATIRRWARQHEGELFLDVGTFQLRVTCRGRTVTFIPRFVIGTQAGLAYTTHFPDDGGFVGWLPYELKRWPLASDKLTFKSYCEQAGLPTPGYSLDTVPQSNDFIVKGQRGSFGQGIHGPYRAGSREAQFVSLSPNEYFEHFIVGDSVKIWYWSGRPAAMERLPAPFVVGDGVRSLREIGATTRGSFDVAYSIDEQASDILAWQQLTPDSIPPTGQRVQLEFKYVTRFDRLTSDDRNVLPSATDIQRAQLHQIGNSLLQGMPLETRRHTIFTVDAVADADNHLWLLEMNSHPMVHPGSYTAMLDDLFGVSTY